MIMSFSSRKPFSKLLQSLKSTTERKITLLTKHLGRREAVRSKGDWPRQRNWGYYCNNYRDGEHDRFRLAEESLSVYRKGSPTREPISRRDSADDNGIHPRRRRHTSLRSACLSPGRRSAQIWWRLCRHL